MLARGSAVVTRMGSWLRQSSLPSCLNADGRANQREGSSPSYERRSLTCASELSACVMPDRSTEQTLTWHFCWGRHEIAQRRKESIDFLRIYTETPCAQCTKVCREGPERPSTRERQARSKAPPCLVSFFLFFAWDSAQPRICGNFFLSLLLLRSTVNSFNYLFYFKNNHHSILLVIEPD